MKKSEYFNCILIDWNELKNINPKHPVNKSKSINELYDLAKLTGKLGTYFEFYGKILAINSVMNHLTSDIFIGDIINAKKEVDEICKQFNIDSKEFKKRFPMIHRGIWTAYIQLKKQRPDLFEEIKPEKYLVKSELNPGSDLIEDEYEVPFNDNSTKVLQKIIEKYRPNLPVGTIVGTVNKKPIIIEEKDIREESLVREQWVNYLLNNFEDDSIRFKISENFVDIVPHTKEKPKKR